MPNPLKKLLIAIPTLVVFLVVGNQYFRLYACNPYSTSMHPTLRFMTWNVHISDPDFKNKQSAIAAEIIAQDADIVLINEFQEQKA